MFIKDLTKFWELQYKKSLEKLLRIKGGEQDGSIQVHQSNGSYQYYLYYRDGESKMKRRIYLKKADFNIAKKIVRASYQRRAKKLLEEQIQVLEQFNAKFDLDKLDMLYESLAYAKKILVKPVMPTRKQQIEDWAKKPYIGKANYNNSFLIKTKRGEMVRSKSEKILADMFFDHGKCYKYECPLSLKSGQTIYPDFTFFDPIICKEIYWEHFGMIEDPAYSLKMMNKIMAYEMNGIFLGERLIITMEGKSQPLNLTWAEEVMKKQLY